MNESSRSSARHCDATNRVPPARLGDGPRCGDCKAPLFQAKPLAWARSASAAT